MSWLFDDTGSGVDVVDVADVDDDGDNDADDDFDATTTVSLRVLLATENLNKYRYKKINTLGSSNKLTPRSKI